MKQAISANGNLVLASCEAPEQAICPICKGAVVLRHRRLMNQEGTSFYWRHLRNRNRSCHARTNLIQYHVSNRPSH